MRSRFDDDGSGPNISEVVAEVSDALRGNIRRFGPVFGGLLLVAVVVTGVSVNVGVAGNVLVASELGYHVLVPDDCVAASDMATHRAIVDNQFRMVSRVVQSEDILAALAG